MEYRIQTQNLQKNFGGIHALKSATSTVKSGEIHNPVTAFESVEQYLGGNNGIQKLMNTEPAVIMKNNVADKYDPASVF